MPLLTPVAAAAPGAGRITVTTTIDGDAERVMAAPVRGRPGWIAVAGASLESANGTVSALDQADYRRHGVRPHRGGGAYMLARAALAPVERLRREAAALSEQRPGRAAACAEDPR